MNEGRMLFPRCMDFLARDAFRACVKKYKGDSYCKDFTCRDQFSLLCCVQESRRRVLRYRFHGRFKRVASID